VAPGVGGAAAGKTLVAICGLASDAAGLTSGRGATIAGAGTYSTLMTLAGTNAGSPLSAPGAGCAASLWAGDGVPAACGSLGAGTGRGRDEGADPASG
jgi:hypothetical protein